MSSSHVLIINPGSSSIKWELFDSLCAKCALKNGRILQASLHEYLQQLQIRLSPATCVIRFVHGGANYVGPTRLSVSMIPGIEELNELAPLHDAISIECSKYLLTNFKDMAVVAVFDTEFFNDLPEVAKTYGLPMA